MSDYEFYTLDEVAEQLGKTTQTIRNMIKRGELEAVPYREGKKGRPHIRVTASSYGRYLLSRKSKERG